MNLVISSFELNDTIRMSNMTDLPLIQGIWFNKSNFTYDYNVITYYASGVKSEMDLLVYYP